ncbi:MAG: hypothetical protein M3Z04_03435 [Chloroflexota bacterium]|nr:hypothetical protein [Chloroflexota bacterium]
MKYALLLLGALALLGVALMTGGGVQAAALRQVATPLPTPVTSDNTGVNGTGRPGVVGSPVQPPSTPGGQGNGAPPGPGGGAAVDQGTGSVGASGGQSLVPGPPPANLAGPEPNMLIGYVPAILLPLGIIGALIGAFVAIRREGQKAQRQRQRGTAGGEAVTTHLPPR